MITKDDATRRYIIHFVSYFFPTPPTIGSYVLMSPMEEMFRYNAKVAVRLPIKRVEALNPATRIMHQGESIELDRRYS